MARQDLSVRLFFWHDEEMGTKFESAALSGVWSGQYWMEDGDSDAVRFSAWVSIENDRLHGSTLEPNLFKIGNADESEAVIRGHVSEDEIVFLKSYRGVNLEPIYYEGELSDCGQKILGRWYFGWPEEASGRFEMTLQSARKQSTSSHPAKMNLRK